METIDKKVEAIKKLQEELEYRKRVEKEAEALICEGECEKASALLATLDDNVVKELVEAGVDDEESEGVVEADQEENGDTQTDKEISKPLVTYSNVYTNADGVKVIMEVETECSTHDRMRETLSFIAQSSHKFYLEAAEKFKSKL